MDDIVIGIDLGTTNSCAACYIDGNTNILENVEGGRVTPSVVKFGPKNEVVVGPYAKKMAIMHPKNVVFEIKRLIGRQIDDPNVQKILKYFPFSVDKTADGEPVVLIGPSDETIRKSPLEISALILTKIKADVETKLGHTVNKAVITVPAYFNVKQREVTLGAAQEAGFTVLKLLNEPTAAALSFYNQKKCESEHYSLVYDLGGGTFDVALLKRNSENIEIISVAGHTQLGGQDFDNLIVDHVCKKLKENYDFDFSEDRRTLRRLHNYCEDAKITLSGAEETMVILDGLVKDHGVVQITLKRQEFEDMAADLFKQTISIVDTCLKIVNMPRSKIQDVILAGGSTRIPKIQSLLTEYFDGKVLNHLVNQDECVAEGAALQAALLSTNPSQNIPDMKITDVVPLSLGTPKLGDVLKVLIKRNTPIPVSHEEIWTNINEGQRSMVFKIYEGERLNALKNRFLGKLKITGLTPAPPRQCKVVLTMTIDGNGILTVSAKEKYKEDFKDLKIDYIKGHISDVEVANTLKDAEDHKEEDEKFVEFAELKAHLVEFCVWLIYNFDTKNLVSQYRDIYDLCKTVKKDAATSTVEDLDNLRASIVNLKTLCQPIVAKHDFKN